MRQRSLQALRTDVSELALGTWGLSGDAYGPVSQAEAEAVIDRALELGITLFDTADCYAQGNMERVLGERIRKHGSKATIVTRAGTDRSAEAARKSFEPGYLREAIDKSRERIGGDRVGAVLLHNPSVVTVERGEATAFLKELALSGAIGTWGVSAGTREVAVAAVEAGAPVLSLAYNIFHARLLHSIAGEVAMRGVSVLAHSVLSYGLLTSHWGPERTFDEGDHRRDRWTPAALRRRVAQLHLVRDLVGGDVLSARAAALRFVLSNRLVTSAILGPRTTSQLDQLVREAGQGPPYLPDAALSLLPQRLLAAGINT